MLKRRDATAIGSVGEYLFTSSQELTTYKNILNTHIESILEYYKGKDADFIVAKFLDASSKIDMIVKVIEYYGDYMMTLSNHDKSNIQLANNSLQPMLTDILGNNNFLNDEVSDSNILGVKEV